jgi:hypothetical protein
MRKDGDEGRKEESIEMYDRGEGRKVGRGGR